MPNTSNICFKCSHGLQITNNSRDSEYYSKVYTNKSTQSSKQLIFYIEPCKHCWHGRFIKSFYVFPKIKITEYKRNKFRDLIVKIDNKDISVQQLLYNWIKYRNIDKLCDVVLL